MTAVKEGGWRRHLGGWQAGLVVVTVVGLAMALGLPRAVTPPDFPLPVPDGRRLRTIAQQDEALAEQLARSPEEEREGPAFELRQLGALLRRYGEADAVGDTGALQELRGPLLRGAHNLLQGGPEGLLRLRAYQRRIFLRELGRWEATGQESEELRQVGGGILRALRAEGWVQPPRRFVAGEHVRAALFKRRFAEVLGLQGRPEFALDLEESRALHGFLLAHPPAQGSGAWVFRLRKLEDLAKVDPSYPRKLARGVALLRLGQGAAAVVELREHLAERPDGPHTLRARNYLAAAVELAERQGGAMP
jgi:hypothetical protein